MSAGLALEGGALASVRWTPSFPSRGAAPSDRCRRVRTRPLSHTGSSMPSVRGRCSSTTCNGPIRPRSGLVRCSAPTGDGRDGSHGRCRIRLALDVLAAAASTSFDSTGLPEPMPTILSLPSRPDLSDDRLEDVLDRADGNPFLLLELAQGTSEHLALVPAGAPRAARSTRTPTRRPVWPCSAACRHPECWATGSTHCSKSDSRSRSAMRSRSATISSQPKRSDCSTTSTTVSAPRAAEQLPVGEAARPLPRLAAPARTPDVRRERRRRPPSRRASEPATCSWPGVCRWRSNELRGVRGARRRAPSGRCVRRSSSDLTSALGGHRISSGSRRPDAEIELAARGVPAGRQATRRGRRGRGSGLALAAGSGTATEVGLRIEQLRHPIRVTFRNADTAMSLATETWRSRPRRRRRRGPGEGAPGQCSPRGGIAGMGRAHRRGAHPGAAGGDVDTTFEASTRSWPPTCSGGPSGGAERWQSRPPTWRDAVIVATGRSSSRSRPTCWRCSPDAPARSPRGTCLCAPAPHRAVHLAHAVHVIALADLGLGRRRRRRCARARPSTPATRPAPACSAGPRRRRTGFSVRTRPRGRRGRRMPAAWCRPLPGPAAGGGAAGLGAVRPGNEPCRSIRRAGISPGGCAREQGRGRARLWRVQRGAGALGGLRHRDRPRRVSRCVPDGAWGRRSAVSGGPTRPASSSSTSRLPHRRTASCPWPAGRDARSGRSVTGPATTSGQRHVDPPAREVLSHVADGHTSTETAAILGLQVSTVDAHIKAAMERRRRIDSTASRAART